MGPVDGTHVPVEAEGRVLIFPRADPYAAPRLGIKGPLARAEEDP
jgi:hypothetical protein